MKIKVNKVNKGEKSVVGIKPWVYISDKIPYDGVVISGYNLSNNIYISFNDLEEILKMKDIDDPNEIEIDLWR